MVASEKKKKRPHMRLPYGAAGIASLIVLVLAALIFVSDANHRQDLADSWYQLRYGQAREVAVLEAIAETLPYTDDCYRVADTVGEHYRLCWTPMAGADSHVSVTRFSSAAQAQTELQSLDCADIISVRGYEMCLTVIDRFESSHYYNVKQLECQAGRYIFEVHDAYHSTYPGGVGDGHIALANNLLDLGVLHGLIGE